MSVIIREKKISGGRVSLYLDIYNAGRRNYEFLDIYLTKDREQRKEARQLAESIRAKRQLEIQSGNYGFAASFKQKTNFLDYFKKNYEKRQKTENLRGIQNYETAYKYLEQYTRGRGIQIGSIDEKWLEDFKGFLAENMKSNTANNYYARVKAVLRIAHKEKYITQNPAENVRYFKPTDTEKEFLTADELRILSETPCNIPDIKRAFLFACYTGLRHSDIRALKWGAIKDGKIHYRQKKTQGFEYMPLNETARSLLAQCRGENEIPFPDKAVFNIPDTNHIGAKLKPWIAAAGIKKNISFHCSRHTFATSLLTSGADLYTTSKLLGHKSISSTQVYAKVIDQKKMSAVNGMEQLAGVV